MTIIPDNEYELSAGQQDLRAELRSFVTDAIDPLDFQTREWHDDPDTRIPWDAVETGAERGLMDLTVPEEYGGRDVTALSLVMGAEELSAGDMGLAVIFDQNWKIARVIDHLATDDVRESFFTEYVDDPRHLLAITSTEPQGGSDAILPYENGQYATTAEKDGDEWVINGEKRFISNGADAKTYVVLAQTDPESPHHEGGATAFYVPGDTDGLEVTNVWEKMSQRLVNNATIEFTDVRVPDAYVLGELNAGMSSISQVLKEGNIEAGATALGTARGAIDLAFEYATERTQGGPRSSTIRSPSTISPGWSPSTRPRARCSGRPPVLSKSRVLTTTRCSRRWRRCSLRIRRSTSASGPSRSSAGWESCSSRRFRSTSGMPSRSSTRTARRRCTHSGLPTASSIGTKATGEPTPGR